MTESALLSILNSGPRKEIFHFQGIKRDIVFNTSTFLEKTRDFRYRSIKGFCLVLKNSQCLLERQNDSGILDNRPEKAMENTIIKLC